MIQHPVPIILCIESSTKVCSVALSTQSGDFIIKEDIGENNHSSVITTLISKTLAEAQITMNHINAIAVSSGPGSYTGLRIGVNTAKALCFALDLPLISLDSCQILLYDLEVFENEVGMGMIDARRSDVYVAIKSIKGITKSIFSTLDQDFFSLYSGNLIKLSGDGSIKGSEILNTIGVPHQIIHTKTSAALMINAAIDAYTKQIFANHLTFEPNYLKTPNITIPKKH
jgi:tRNA threonylcarbamoyladenosine biosynthesis protein TsaB